ncbi:hypothetical protein BDY24DRAFT_344629, partial [Mrakia frigida]|uniref:C2H2-type zinc finger protein n=1 Tax=Mrakia frigida TaxID=29902 RepID=UPI003FCBEEC2
MFFFNRFSPPPPSSPSPPPPLFFLLLSSSLSSSSGPCSPVPSVQIDCSERLNVVPLSFTPNRSNPTTSTDAFTTPSSSSSHPSSSSSLPPPPPPPYHPHDHQAALLLSPQTPEQRLHDRLHHQPPPPTPVLETYRLVAPDYTPSGAASKSTRISTPKIQKSFQCVGYGLCAMTFMRSEHLARHVRKHTGEKPFVCHCTRSFSRIDNLRQHCAAIHPDSLARNEQTIKALLPVHATLAQQAGRDHRLSKKGK